MPARDKTAESRIRTWTLREPFVFEVCAHRQQKRTNVLDERTSPSLSRMNLKDTSLFRWDKILQLPHDGTSPTREQLLRLTRYRRTDENSHAR